MEIVSQKEQLLKTLCELPDDDFKVFKWYLKYESRLIPFHRLERADRMDVVDEVAQTYSVEAVKISLKILKKMNRYDVILRLTKVKSQNEVKTTVCHIQTQITATNGGTVIYPNISDCRIHTLNISVTNQDMTEQSYLRTFVPPPERPLSVFPSQVCSLLNLQRGHVDADDLALLNLMEQWKTLEPRKKSLLMLKIQQMIHEARFDSDTS